MVARKCPSRVAGGGTPGWTRANSIVSTRPSHFQPEAARRRLLKAHRAGAVPLELLREEQARITDDLAKAGVLIENSGIHWEELERNLRMAFAWAFNLGRTYAKASPKVRRQMIQARLCCISFSIDEVLRLQGLTAVD